MEYRASLPCARRVETASFSLRELGKQEQSFPSLARTATRVCASASVPAWIVETTASLLAVTRLVIVSLPSERAILDSSVAITDFSW